MEIINKFTSFLDLDLASIFPPELVGEIGQRFFWNFYLNKDITYDNLFKLSPYISCLHLGSNNRIKQLPRLTNLQKLHLDYNNRIVELPDLPNLQSLHLGNNKKIIELPDLPNLQELNIGYNNKIDSNTLIIKYPNLRIY